MFTLKQVYGLSQKEIAGRLKISEKTVEYHVSKGLLDCRRYLKRREVEGVKPALQDHMTVVSALTKLLPLVEVDMSASPPQGGRPLSAQIGVHVPGVQPPAD